MELLSKQRKQATPLRTHFHLYPSQEQLGSYLSAVLRHFQWTNISVITQEDLSTVITCACHPMNECDPVYESLQAKWQVQYNQNSDV